MQSIGKQQKEIMDILAFGTPFGLAFASGLNAYLPMLAFTLAVRWLHLYKVNPNFAFITSNWFIAALVILTILDFVADKIPLIDHGWDAIHTVIRPLAGAIVAAASSQYVVGPHSTPFTSYVNSGITMAAFSSTISVTGIGLLAVLLIGGALAALMHITKSTTRLVSTLTTAGFLNIGLSVAEDILVVIVILLSLFASSIMFVLLVLLVLILVPRLIQSWYARRNRRGGIL